MYEHCILKLLNSGYLRIFMTFNDAILVNINVILFLTFLH